MARLSYDERIKRLENRYNELVKPTFIIAESRENGVAAVTILSNGKRSEQFFKSYEAFTNHITTVENCNIIADNKLLQFRDTELKEAVAKASKEDLQAIADGQVTPQIIERVLYEPIVAKIR